MPTTALRTRSQSLGRSTIAGIPGGWGGNDGLNRLAGPAWRLGHHALSRQSSLNS